MNRGFKDIFLIIFPLTAILFGALLYFLNLKALGPQGVWLAVSLGFACGLVFGVGVGYFARTMEYSFDIDPTVDMQTRMQLLLLEMGYQLDNQFKKVMTFVPTLRAGIFADRIRVEMLHGVIRMEGPSWHIEQLRTKLGV